MQGALKGGNGMIPLPFFQTAHAYPEVVFGAAHGLEQQSIGFQGSIKGAGVGQFFGPFQFFLAGAGRGQRGQVLFEQAYGIGAGQQGAGPAAKGSELFRLAVAGQNEQHGQVQEQGVQAEHGAELFAVHIG